MLLSFIAACAQIFTGKTVICIQRDLDFHENYCSVKKEKKKKRRLRQIFFEDPVIKAFSECFCQEVLPCELEGLPQAYLLLIT